MLRNRLRHTVQEDPYAVVLKHTIGADYSSGVDAIEAPADLEIVDVVVHATAANASGTVTVRKGTDAVTDAIAMEVNHTVARAGTIDDAYRKFVSGQKINLITNGAGDRGVVWVLARPL